MINRIKHKLISYILYLIELRKRLKFYKKINFLNGKNFYNKINNDLYQNSLENYGEFQVSSTEKKLTERINLN